MASGEEDEVQLQEAGARRTTRATRAVATRRSRGRKKAAASPRTTRSKRNTRTAQSAESDEVEDDDEEVQEETQNTSDAEAQQDLTSPEAEKDDDEEPPSVVNKSTEESSTVENGIVEENHKSDEQEPSENDKNNSEKAIADVEKSEETSEMEEEQKPKEEKQKSKEEEQKSKEEKQKSKEEEQKSEEEEQKTKEEEEKPKEKKDEVKQKKDVELKEKKDEVKQKKDEVKEKKEEEIKEKKAKEVKENKDEIKEKKAKEVKENKDEIKEKKEDEIKEKKEDEIKEKKKDEVKEEKVEVKEKKDEIKEKKDEVKEKKEDVKDVGKDNSESDTKGIGESAMDQDAEEDNKETVNGKTENNEVKVEKELHELKVEEESISREVDKEVPELEDSPPPTINTVLPSPIRSGLKIKIEPTTPTNAEENPEVKEVSKEKDVDSRIAEEIKPNAEKSEANENEKCVPIKEEKQEEPMEVDTKEESEVEQANESTESHMQEDDITDMKPENVEDMTVIDEVTEEGQEEKNEAASGSTPEKAASAETGDAEGGFRTEPDTEMVSEDELPTESSKEHLETEAVSDEELPDPAAAVDLPETEAVSEDELPPEKNDKKKKKTAKQSDSSGKKKSRSEAQKRKLADGDTYDPSSPTSENSCDESPAAKRAAVAGAGGGAQAKPVAKTRKSLPELEKYWKAVKEDPSDFTGWTYLLQYVDQENDIEAAREAYDAFLSHYPYCYGYWRKYADYEKRKGNKEKCEEVFERGLKAIPLSVDLWIHFLNYSKTTYAENEEHLRTQFEKAINACGMEFRSDRLWESYIKWETEGKRLQNVTKLYDRLLAMPTQGYTNHFDNFQEHISSNPPQKVLSVDEFLTLRREVLQLLKQYDQPTTIADDSAPGEEVEAPPGEEPEEQPVVKTDEETTALRERIIFIRRKVHKATVSAVADRWNFEEGIKRPYFHVKPLERCQLKNWKEYLDFEIEQGDQERIIVLFERCLIACALYEEFWIKFIRYLESLKGDTTDKIRNVYDRACTIHHTKKPNLHLHWAVFEESHQNYDKASEILNNLEKLVPNMLQVAYRRINLERRCNNMDKVCSLYEHYITNTKNKVISNNMAIKYARFCWKVKGDIEKAISILNKAVDKDKDNPRLYLQLIDMGLQQNPLNEDTIVSIIDQFLNRDTDPEQKVLFAQRKVEFLEDFGSDILSVQKAHDEFQRYLKQAKDRKKKSPDLDGKSLDGSSKKVKSLSDSMQMHSSHVPSHTSPQSTHSSTSQQPPQPPSGSQTPTATTSAGQYPPNYSQTGGYSQQPPAQGSYQGGQYPPAGPQQPPTPYSQPPYNQQYGQSSDPNYANYQNWGYSQTGYGGYNQGWGNYNYY